MKEVKNEGSKKGFFVFQRSLLVDGERRFGFISLFEIKMIHAHFRHV